MSIDALKWAWTAPVDSAPERLVLLSLADRAGEEHTAWPSISRLENDTKLNRKTVQKVIADLIGKGLVADTGERKGPTRSVRVLKLLGVNDNRSYPKNGAASNDESSDTKIGTATTASSPKNGTATNPKIGQAQNSSSPKNGTATNPKIGQAQNSSSPKNGMASDPKFGIQNLPLNPKIKNKKNNTDDFLTAAEAKAIWIPSLEHVNTLLLEKDQPVANQTEIDSLIVDFNRNNHGKDHSQNQMYLHFRIWIINARAAASKVKSTPPTPSTGQMQAKPQEPQQPEPQRTTDTTKQRERTFAEYSDNQIYSGTYTAGHIRQNMQDGESPEQCMLRLTKQQLAAAQQAKSGTP